MGELKEDFKVIPFSTVYSFDDPEDQLNILNLSLFYTVLKNTLHLKELSLLDLQHPRWKT